MDGGLYPISLLIDEMKSEDAESRIAAMRKLRVIAGALGPERTRKELVPFLNGACDERLAVACTCSIAVRCRRACNSARLTLVTHISGARFHPTVPHLQSKWRTTTRCCW